MYSLTFDAIMPSKSAASSSLTVALSDEGNRAALHGALDIRTLAEAEKSGVPMPSVQVVRDRLTTGIARGYADRDWTALGLVAAQEAGVPAESR